MDKMLKILSMVEHDKTNAITAFKGEHEFLSNFHPLKVPIKWLQLFFRTNEHFYQAMKTLEEDERRWIANLDKAWKAKRAGGKYGFEGRKITYRPGFDTKRIIVMYIGNLLKYTADYNLLFRLVATHPRYLLEGNNWHDNYWGDCHCSKCTHIPGQNNLGLILMYLRTQFMIVG